MISKWDFLTTPPFPSSLFLNFEFLVGPEDAGSAGGVWLGRDQIGLAVLVDEVCVVQLVNTLIAQFVGDDAREMAGAVGFD